MGISRRQLLRRVGTLCKNMKLEAGQFNKKIPGKDWFAGFLKWHPTLSIRKPEMLSTTRQEWQTLHQPVRIIAEKGSNTVVGRTSSCRTNITVMACVNAAGSKMSPLLIVKGKTSRSLHGFYTFTATEYSNKLHKHDALLFFRVYFGSFVRSNLCFCFTSLHVCSMNIWIQRKLDMSRITQTHPIIYLPPAVLGLIL